MRKIFFIVLFIFCIGNTYSFAGSFLGIKPGYSTKEDVDNVLDTPVKVIAEGKRYDYSTEGQDARRISVLYGGTPLRVRSIDLYFKKEYSKEQLKKWFELDNPQKSVKDEEGKLVEYYSPEGIALHFTGENDSTPVEYFSHFDNLATEALPEKEIPFFGLYVCETKEEYPSLVVLEVMSNSPVERAGIKDGDSILEVAGERMSMEKGITKKLMNILNRFSPGEEVPFLIQRGPEQFEVVVIPEGISREEAGRKNVYDKEKAAMYFEKARTAYEMNNYPQTIANLNEAIRYQRDNAVYYTGLGITYWTMHQYDLALESFEKSLLLGPSLAAYVKMGEIYRERGDYRTAIVYLEKGEELWDNSVGNTTVLDLLGHSYFMNKEVKKAYDVLMHSNMVDPNGWMSLYLLGCCHEFWGNNQKALEYYQKYQAAGNGSAEQDKIVSQKIYNLKRRR